MSDTNKMDMSQSAARQSAEDKLKKIQTLNRRRVKLRALFVD